MKKALLLGFVCLLCRVVYADDQVAAVQQQLKDQGFFYGAVDGQDGTETSAAIRRYQIRNGLEVTGGLNQETLSSMKITGAAKQAASGGPAPAVQPDGQATNAQPAESQPAGGDVAQQDREFLRQQARQPVPQSPAGPPPARYVEAPPAAEAENANLGAFYARTPYETAPNVVQVDTLRRAQATLTRYGYYRGAVDGFPGPNTQRALVSFQQNAGLASTGRLDMDTLAALRLLPGRHYFNAAPPAQPYSAPLRGIWIH